MEIEKQQALEQFRSRLSIEVPEAHHILSTFEHAGLALRRAEPTERAAPPRTWLLFWEPQEELRQSFDLAPEVLLVLTPFREAQVRDVSAAEQALGRDHRLDRGVVLVAARDEAAQDHLAQPVRHTGRLYVFLPFSRVLGARNPQRWLHDVLQERVGSADLFAAGRPVFGWDFVGRQQEIQTIRRRLLDGRPVGLYGLRKAGKTSVLIALRDQIIADSIAARHPTNAIPIHLDLLSLSFAEMKRSGFMRYLLRAMHEALKKLEIDPTTLGLPASFTDIRRLNRLDGEDVERLVPEAIECLIDWAQGQSAPPAILLFIDEYERLLGASGFPLKDGLDILDYLRGLVQRYPGAFNFLIAGLDRQKASVSRYGQRQNPLFNFVVDYPLAGLTREEMGELFHKIGRRLSLHFQTDALDVIWQETGGHPYLARELGRIIDKATPVKERAPKEIDRAVVNGHLERFLRDVAQTMQEIRDAVDAIDPEALGNLTYAVHYPKEVKDALAMIRPESLDTLRRYGVLNEEGNPHALRIGSFGTWLLQNESLFLRAQANG